MVLKVEVTFLHSPIKILFDTFTRGHIYIYMFIYIYLNFGE